MPVPTPSDACPWAPSVAGTSSVKNKTGPMRIGTGKIQLQQSLLQGRLGLFPRPWPPWPAWSGRCEGDAGTPGAAGVAGVARVAEPSPGCVAGVARPARSAGVAGVTASLSRPTASPRTCVAGRAIDAFFAFAISEGWELGAGVCAASSDGTNRTGISSSTRFTQPPNGPRLVLIAGC